MAENSSSKSKPKADAGVEAGTRPKRRGPGTAAARKSAGRRKPTKPPTPSGDPEPAAAVVADGAGGAGAAQEQPNGVLIALVPDGNGGLQYGFQPVGNVHPDSMLLHLERGLIAFREIVRIPR